MTVSDFLNYHRLTENPFRGEEARSDSVFTRMRLEPGVAGEAEGALGAIGLRPAPAPGPHEAMDPFEASHRRPSVYATLHSDFEKILGDLRRPSASVVFGEKGSGKTAIRMQLAQRIREHNARNPADKILLVAYDDLNGILGRLHERLGGKTPLESFQKIRLVDHIDGILHTIVPRVVDAALGRSSPEAAELGLDFGIDPKKSIRRLDNASKRDLLVLQAIYDRPEFAENRTFRLRQALVVGLPWTTRMQTFAALFAPFVLGVAGVYRWFFAKADELPQPFTDYLLFSLFALYAIFLVKYYGFDRLMNLRLARRIRRQVRVVARNEVSFARSLRQLDKRRLDPTTLPTHDADDCRYANIERLRRVTRHFGFSGMFFVIDRVDEPTLISGDPERMRSVVWPLLNNKFLQQPGVGVKMLLPVELRHALFKESSAFFQEARLDKQNFIERLTWSGAMLYDLCNARLQACRLPEPQGTPAAGLMDLFAEDVTRQEVVDALDQMHQPRDAFKLIYRCITEHCSMVTKDQSQWRIPRLVLETVKRSESDRVQGLQRGIRPG